MISYLNLVSGLVALASNFFILFFFGPIIYGIYASLLLIQGLSLAVCDLGLSNVLIQRKTLPIQNLAIYSLVSLMVTILFFCGTIFLSQITEVNFSLVGLWSILAATSVYLTVILQREFLIYRIVFADLIYVLLFATFMVIVFFREDKDLDVNDFLLFQIACYFLKVVALVPIGLSLSNVNGRNSWLTKSEISSSGLQLLDRVGRYGGAKAEQIVMSFLLNGAQLGAFMFYSNIANQIMQRLSSPLTRRLVSKSRSVDFIDFSYEFVADYRKYIKLIVLLAISATLTLGIVSLLSPNLMDLIQEKSLVSLPNLPILVLAVGFFIARLDIEFLVCGLLCKKLYKQVTMFNVFFAVTLIITLLLIFVVNIWVISILVVLTGVGCTFLLIKSDSCLMEILYIKLLFFGTYLGGIWILVSLS